MKTSFLTIFLLAACPLSAAETPSALPPEVAQQLDAQNVVWDTPSADAKGSMPIGNGDLGLNVWVEPSGDLCFFIGKSDAWNENMTLCKVGKVRVKFTPALVEKDQPFEWKLDLKGGRIVVKTAKAQVVLWVDAHHNVIQVDATGQDGQKLEATASFEIWRKEKRLLKTGKNHTSESYHEQYSKLFVYPDTVLANKPNQIGWYHRNPESTWMGTLEVQNLKEIAETQTDPLLNRTFGAIIRGGAEGEWKAASDTELRAAPAEKLSLRVHSLTAITDTAEAWESQIEAQADAVDKLDVAARAAAHAKWWGDFWNRSWIFVKDDGQSSLARLPGHDKPWRVGVDSAGGSRFPGQITGPQVLGKALTAQEITALAAEQPATETKLEQEAEVSGRTLLAWIKPEERGVGRILDNATAGRPDGILFDTHPGLSLRLMVGGQTIGKANCLTPGKWQHVAATVDGASGKCALYVDGKLVHAQEIALAGAAAPRNAATLTQAYALQRFVNAGAGRGAYPIKFNGSLFTVDNTPFGPDYRRWCGGYWLQNTRLPYWSMLEAGDFDLMKPLFEHCMRLVPIRKLATKKHYGHDGIYIPETHTFWGTFLNFDYGTNRKNLPDGVAANTYVRRYWVNSLELVTLMLDYHDMTRDPEFLKDTLIPFAIEVTTFYDQHWKRNDKGKIHFDPAQSNETYHVAVNPIADIAALHHVLPRLVAKTQDAKQVAAWRKTLADLPPIPTHTDAKTGKVRWVPGESYAVRKNIENPELYALFPYRFGTVADTKEERAIAANTWEARRSRQGFGWHQDSMMAAMQGFTDEAKNYVINNSKRIHPGFRFPVMWDAHYDWVPDQDHGTVMMTGLQYMAMQYEGDKILLLPAWPKDWDAHFKLHAPRQTTVECKVESGRITLLKVTPESRKKDVVLLEGWQAP